ncbi:hypothetical protein Y1Q_0022685 [Alligator mississippiensis]|uniref:Uncharacterized protein n=1 Tax=Alligator mississippiensis TaxID=8496 RepID=A0A151PHK9_ALLMI|nr:hypothetical protein Y1Q_0022685 [Alligator mississippiensis]
METISLKKSTQLHLAIALELLTCRVLKSKIATEPCEVFQNRQIETCWPKGGSFLTVLLVELFKWKRRDTYR